MSRTHSPTQHQQALEHDFNPIIFHYVKKTGIERSRTLGVDSAALCGSRGTFSTPIGGRPMDVKQGRTICPLCQLVYDGLPSTKEPSNG